MVVCCDGLLRWWQLVMIIIVSVTRLDLSELYKVFHNSVYNMVPTCIYERAPVMNTEPCNFLAPRAQGHRFVPLSRYTRLTASLSLHLISFFEMLCCLFFLLRTKIQKFQNCFKLHKIPTRLVVKKGLKNLLFKF